MTDVTVEGDFPKLRIYHCMRNGNDIFMFVNEDATKTVDTVVNLPCEGDFARLDLLTEICTSGTAEGGKLSVRLLPYQSQIIVFGDKAGLPDEIAFIKCETIEPIFTLELAECDDLSAYEPQGTFDHFFNVNSPNFLPDFSGKMKYRFTFKTERTDGKVFLDLGRVGQNAELSVNDMSCGIRISAPYLFDITDAIRDGDNRIEVIVSNTLAQKVRDRFTRFLGLAPSGLLGGITLKYEK